MIQAKELCENCGISYENLKYFKKKKIFWPEEGRKGYTENDVENLKRIVVLRKAGLTCDDIKSVQDGKMSLAECIENRREILKQKDKQINGALNLSAKMMENRIQFDTKEMLR